MSACAVITRSHRPQNHGLVLPPVQLRQNLLKLVRDRQPQERGIFQHRQVLIAQIERHHRTTQRTAGTDHMYVHVVGHAYQHEDQYHPEAVPEPHLAGEFLSETAHTSVIYYCEMLPKLVKALR